MTVFRFCFLVVDGLGGRSFFGSDRFGGLAGLEDGSVFLGLVRDGSLNRIRRNPSLLGRCRRCLERVTEVTDTCWRRPSCFFTMNVHVASLIVMFSVLILCLRSITVRSRLRTTECCSGVSNDGLSLKGEMVGLLVSTRVCRLSWCLWSQKMGWSAVRGYPAITLTVSTRVCRLYVFRDTALLLWYRRRG